jgi:hypothetical protein
MSTYNLELVFLGGDVEKGELPGAIAYVGVKQWIEEDENGQVLISHQCVGPSEWEAEITRLKRELDELLVAGKRAFEKYHRNLRPQR